MEGSPIFDPWAFITIFICHHCLQWGHIRPLCPNRANHQICSKCGDTGHKPHECQGNILCHNCKGAHPATSRACPIYHEILSKVKLDILEYESSKNIINDAPIKPCCQIFHKLSATTNDGRDQFIPNMFNLFSSLNKAMPEPANSEPSLENPSSDSVSESPPDSPNEGTAPPVSPKEPPAQYCQGERLVPESSTCFPHGQTYHGSETMHGLPTANMVTPLKAHLKGRKPCNGYAYILHNSAQQNEKHADLWLMIFHRNGSALAKLNSLNTFFKLRENVQNVLDIYAAPDGQDYIGSIKYPDADKGAQKFLGLLKLCFKVDTK